MYLVMYLMALGALQAHFLCSSSLIANSPRHVAYALQKLFKEELDQLQKMDIITPLGVDETVQWCNSFVLVPKVNGKVRLCLDLVRLNKALIRPVHRGPTLNDIL